MILKYLLSPISIYFIFFLLSFVPAQFNRFVLNNHPREAKKHKYSHYFRIAITFLFYVTTLPLIANIIVSDVQSKFGSLDTLEPVVFDHIVVLGGGSSYDDFYSRSQLGSSGDRLLLAAQLYRQGRAKKILLSGGRRDFFGDGLAESERDAQILTDFGVGREDIILETLSINTRENAEFSLTAYPELKKRTVGLLTSALHMERAHALFCYWGVNMKMLPASIPKIRRPKSILGWFIPATGNLLLVGNYLREKLAVKYNSLYLNSRESSC